MARFHLNFTPVSLHSHLLNAFLSLFNKSDNVLVLILMLTSRISEFKDFSPNVIFYAKDDGIYIIQAIWALLRMKTSLWTYYLCISCHSGNPVKVKFERLPIDQNILNSKNPLPTVYIRLWRDRLQSMLVTSVRCWWLFHIKSRKSH